MEEHILHIITTGLGAMSGAYCAYRLAEKRLRQNEKEKFLTLILIVMQHLEHFRKYLENYDEITKDAKTGVNLAVFYMPFYAPSITEENIASLMELSLDKEMPTCLIEMKYFWKELEEMTHSKGAYYLSITRLNLMKDQLQAARMYLQLLYNNERGNNPKFPPLEPDKIINK